MQALLNETPGLDCVSPAGAFYAFACCAGLIGRTSAGGRPCVNFQAVCQPMKNTAILFPNGSRR